MKCKDKNNMASSSGHAQHLRFLYIKIIKQK